MLTQTLFLTLASLLPTHDANEAEGKLQSILEVTPKEILFGDVVYVRVKIKNVGKKPVLAPTGTFGALLQLQDLREDTTYDFYIIGGSGMRPQPAPLGPGEERVLERRVLGMPSLDWVNRRFWKPSLWPPGEYRLTGPSRIPGHGQLITIKRRPKAEMDALLLYYGKDLEKHVRPGTTSDQPPSPSQVEKPESLEALERILSPGSRRDSIHFQRLVEAVREEKKDVAKRREAVKELMEWLAARPEVEREIRAQSLYAQVRGWKPWTDLFHIDLAKQVIPYLPPSERAYAYEEDIARRDARQKLLQKRQAEAAGKDKAKEDGRTPEPVRLE